MNSFAKKSQGFTLIEALVAIAVLLVSIAGPMTIASNGIRNSVHAKNQVIAFYLAQEAIEIIRSKRDTNALENKTWLTGIPAGVGGICRTAPGCGIDAQTMAFIACSSATACDINYELDGLTTNPSQRGIYQHGPGDSATVFNRSIIVRPQPSYGPQEHIIEVTVEWQSPRGDQELTVVSRIFDQYDNVN